MAERAGATVVLRDDPFADPAFRAGGAVELLPARPAELLAPLSGAFDLAEAQATGHAVKVAHVAGAVAARLGEDAATRRTVLYAALLHDSGVAVGELPEGVDREGGHTAAGAWVASRFGLDDRIQDAIRCTHERWDGEGRPNGLVMTEVPLESLMIAAAHWACDLIQDIESPLRARAELQHASLSGLDPMVGPVVAVAVADVLRNDAIWIALWDDRLPSLVAGSLAGEGRPSIKTVERIGTAMGEVIDDAVREPGRSRRVAALAAELARMVGLSTTERRAIAVAATLLDVGQLGVPRHITEKPAILSVDEMEQVRHHPGWGARILDTSPALEWIALWVEAHHERPDGRGYPELFSDDEIPPASRILAIADAYWALRAERPYRKPFTAAQARDIIDKGAGTQYDGAIAELLEPALASCGCDSAESPV